MPTFQQIRADQWTKKTIELTQEEVRTWFSANDGYGYKLFEAAGANKIVELGSTILVKLNKTGGAFTAGVFSIINGGDGDDIMTGTVNDTNTKAYIIAKNISSGVKAYIINEEIFMYAPDDNPTYEGTATIIVHYRIIDFS